MSGKEKLVKGVVVSNKTDKTIVIQIEFQKQHPRFGKTINQRKKIMAHDPENKAGMGDVVLLKETRPLSRRKRHELLQIVEKAKQI